MFTIIISVFGAGSVGYLGGRIAHYWLNPKLGNPAWAPHHWIYGVLLLPAGWWVGDVLGLVLAAVGVGLFLSDLDDFRAGLWIGPDDATHPPRFWGFD